MSCDDSKVDTNPYSKVHVAHMGLIWGRQDPGGPQMGHVNLATWEDSEMLISATNPSVRSLIRGGMLEVV